MTALIMTADKIGLKDLAKWLKELNEKRIHNAHVNQTAKQLSKLTDRELNDIGIARGDIWNVARGDTTIERVRRNLEPNKNLGGWV
jgi:uncharacterized protein YjiS (DUF1127 family)